MTKLTIELVPKTSWCENVRSLVDSSTWDILRKETYKGANHRGEICNGVGPTHPVECHETWEYNDSTRIQKLTGLIALCPACHQVKHIGRSIAIGKKDDAIRHLRKVNGWDSNTAHNYINKVFQKWASRNKHQWTLNTTWLESQH